MILSRGASILKATTFCASSNNLRNCIQQSARKSHDWYYRAPAPRNPKMLFLADVVQGYAWWWVLWHLWTEPEHVFGEFPYPDPTEWSDEELGIPS